MYSSGRKRSHSKCDRSPGARGFDSHHLRQKTVLRDSFPGDFLILWRSFRRWVILLLCSAEAVDLPMGILYNESKTLAAVAKWTCLHVRLARCSRK